MRPASARVAVSSSPGATTRLTNPQSAAVRASIISPVSSISIARLRPIARVSATIGVVQNRPIFTPGVANFASLEATARSHVATSWQPAAVAIPAISAITGWGIACSVSISRTHVSKTVRYSSTLRSSISRKSCPALNTGPTPRRIATRAERSAPIASKAAISSRITSSERALRFSGPFRVTTAIPSPPVSTWMNRYGVVASISVPSTPQGETRLLAARPGNADGERRLQRGPSARDRPGLLDQHARVRRDVRLGEPQQRARRRGRRRSVFADADEGVRTERPAQPHEPAVGGDVPARTVGVPVVSPPLLREQIEPSVPRRDRGAEALIRIGERRPAADRDRAHSAQRVDAELQVVADRNAREDAELGCGERFRAAGDDRRSAV